jgi:type I restriction enzyme S subunit
MKSNYDTLGKYIRPIDVRNSAGKEENLLGVTTQKYFMPSIANTVGTDFSKYKVVRRGQFTYVPDTSRRGDRIAIALLQDWDEGLVSNIYTVFEVTDEEKLSPEYLMLWFKRPEFDRYARFKSHGSVREVFDWDELCKVDLPVPYIAVQRSIVRAYNTIEGRIKHLRELNDNLEATAQLLYQDLFGDATHEVEFSPLGNMGTVITGKTPPTEIISYYGDDVAFIKTPDMRSGVFVIDSEAKLSFAGANSQQNKNIPEKSVLVACIGANAGEVAITAISAQTNQQINALITNFPCFVYHAIKNNTDDFRSMGDGSSTMLNVNKTSFENFPVALPDRTMLTEFEDNVDALFSLVLENQREIHKLEITQQLLVSRLSSGK